MLHLDRPQCHDDLAASFLWGRRKSPRRLWRTGSAAPIPWSASSPSPTDRRAEANSARHRRYENLPRAAASRSSRRKKFARPEFLQRCGKWQPEIIVVVAYGRILPKSILELAPHGCLNVHYSLLPKYRGAAPAAWTIINGETEGGVTTMKLVEKMDAGAIYLQEAISARRLTKPPARCKPSSLPSAPVCCSIHCAGSKRFADATRTR